MKQHPTYRVRVMRGSDCIVNSAIESTAPEHLTNINAVVAMGYRLNNKRHNKRDFVTIERHLYDDRYTLPEIVRYYGAPR